MKEKRPIIIEPHYDEHGRKEVSTEKNRITRTAPSYTMEVSVEGDGKVFKEPVTFREELIKVKLCPPSEEVLVATECLAYADCRSCSISCYCDRCVLHDLPAHEFVQIMATVWRGRSDRGSSPCSKPL